MGVPAARACELAEEELVARVVCWLEETLEMIEAAVVGVDFWDAPVSREVVAA